MLVQGHVLLSAPAWNDRFRSTRRYRLQIMSNSIRTNMTAPTDLSKPTLLTSVKDLPKKYKGILLDQFGVLHDGLKPYPGVQDAVKSLAEAGARILILSNSSRRSSGVIPKLETMEFAPEWFVGAVTSGEVTQDMLQRRPGDFWQGLGSRCLHITWGARGAVSLDGLGLQVVEDPEQVDFIVAHGTEAIGTGDGGEPRPMDLESIRGVLEQCAANPRGPPPMIVANPDIVTVEGTNLRTMPGTLAQWYEAMGGQAVLMGKPGKLIYETAAEILQLAPSDVLAIGDSIEHDIKGASLGGMDTLFIAGGILAKQLGIDDATKSGDLEINSVCELLRGEGVQATYCMTRLVA